MGRQTPTNYNPTFSRFTNKSLVSGYNGTMESMGAGFDYGCGWSEIPYHVQPRQESVYIYIYKSSNMYIYIYKYSHTNLSQGVELGGD